MKRKTRSDMSLRAFSFAYLRELIVLETLRTVLGRDEDEWQEFGVLHYVDRSERDDEVVTGFHDLHLVTDPDSALALEHYVGLGAECVTMQGA